MNSNTDLKFKLAVDNASDHVVITDPDAIVIYANAACYKTTGYLPEEVIGEKAGKLWGNLMDRSFYEQMWKTIKIDKEKFTGEITNKRKNGEAYEASVTISPILDENGTILFFVALERDITKEKAIDRAKNEFISLASHQMRTPLTVINWYTELLREGDAGPLNESQQKYFEEVYNASQQISQIINSFLHILRLEDGHITLHPVSVNLSSIASSTLKESSLAIKHKKLQLTETYEADLPDISLDKELIRVVFQNLISNAVKYASYGERISFSLSRIHKGSPVGGIIAPHDGIVTAVHNFGITIPSHEGEKVFGKFFRGEDAKRADPKGNGLGLYMTKRMVAMMNGTIWFESEEGKGTTFFVLLPLDKSASSPNP